MVLYLLSNFYGCSCSSCCNCRLRKYVIAFASEAILVRLRWSIGRGGSRLFWIPRKSMDLCVVCLEPRENLRPCIPCQGCSGPWSPWYCSTACQNQHWVDHKAVCDYTAIVPSVCRAMLPACRLIVIEQKLLHFLRPPSAEEQADWDRQADWVRQDFYDRLRRIDENRHDQQVLAVRRASRRRNRSAPP